MAQKGITDRKGPAQLPVETFRYPAFTRLDHNRATNDDFDRERLGVGAKE